MRRLIIGLTGGIGSGKTSVAKLFGEHGITLIDTDQIARDVIHPGSSALQQVVKKFGAEILMPNGQLNRAKLRTIIFENPDHRMWLENLLHPLIREDIKKQIEQATSPYCIIIIPLLFETKPNPLIDRVLVVDTSEQNQIERTKIRDKISPAEVRAIIQSQVDRETRIKKADDIIYNEGPLEELIPQVEKLHRFYLGLCSLTDPLK